MIKLRSSVTLLLIGFILGFFTSFFIFGCGKNETKTPISFQKVKQIKKQVDTIDISYQKQIDALQDQNIELQQQLEVSTGLLSEAKQEAQEKEDNIQRLLKPKIDFTKKNLFPNSAKSSLKGESSFKSYLTPSQRDLLDADGIAIFSNAESNNTCDSLKKEVLGYIEAIHRKDSAYELQLISFDSILANKDLVIDASQKAYDNLKSLFDQSLFNQTALQKENKLLRMSNRRKQTQSKLLTASLMILSGLSLGAFLHH